MELLIALLSGSLAAAAGGLLTATKELLQTLMKRSPSLQPFFESRVGKVLLSIYGIEQRSADGGTAKLLTDLSNTAATMDRIVAEIGRVTHERQATVTKLEADLLELSKREEELKGRIKALESVPVPALNYFEEILRKQEKPTARRDYLLFLAGVILTTVIAILLKKYGLA
jgi:cell division protein FtsB